MAAITLRVSNANFSSAMFALKLGANFIIPAWTKATNSLIQVVGTLLRLIRLSFLKSPEVAKWAVADCPRAANYFDKFL